MPIHVAPPIRAREEVMEAAGTIQPLDSVAVTQAKAREAAGVAVKAVPIAYQTEGLVANGKRVKVT